MPRKHRAKAGDDDVYNLPPSTIARPRAVGPSQPLTANFASKKSKKKRAKNGLADDTPKAFTRLMFKRPGTKMNGLDDGNPRPNASKKRKRGPTTEDAPIAEPSSKRQHPSTSTTAAPATDKQNTNRVPTPEEVPDHSLPKILPNEPLSAFYTRVNAALPLGNLARKSKSGDPGHHRTKHEKKLMKLQAGWRQEEARIREKEEEEREQAEEEKELLKEKWGEDIGVLDSLGKRRARKAAGGGGQGEGKEKRGRKQRQIGEVEDAEDDPWAEVNARANPLRGSGLHDTVQAPPTLTKPPREKLKVHDGAKVKVGDIPTAAGSLRRREELEVEREGVIARYRRMMEEKRGREELKV
ncbi:hypothetical protein K402DRAFT_463429 [Aulographum hederae CBS 113979]|uniref:Urease accessory protein UreD n=1 Tax=Aulographum hederae CBS 113979 TaxID=1176131 RepID=A0A6G1GZU3_9PEZI|nr:hypothetical protein K402DRAFT_463429 [Aulographum hederae CBS 113979]